MFSILNEIVPKTKEDKNNISYLKTVGAIKTKNIDFAINCFDSTSFYLEKEYGNAVQEKYRYYTSYINKVQEKAEIKGKAEMQKWVFLLSVLLLISLLIMVRLSCK